MLLSIIVVHVGINGFLVKIREERFVNRGYHVERQNIIAILRDNSQKIKCSHVDLNKGVW